MAYQAVILETQRNVPLRPGVLWDLLANTDNLNREIGMPTVAYGPVVVSADGFYRQAAARFWGLVAARWREYPFEWVRGERYAVLRVFETGFMDVFYGGVDLRSHPEGTSVRVFAELTPRTLIGWAAARMMGRKGIRDTLAYCERFVAPRQSGVDLQLPPSTPVTPPDQARLDQLVAGLQSASLPGHLVNRCARHLATAPDREVLRMQPYALADGWGADRADVLRLFMQATRLGALYHTWEIMCPNCRLPKGRARTLGGVPTRIHCDVCAVEYDADLAQNVELRYSVHPTLRSATDEIYCIGGPSNSPHVWSQQYLLPGTERSISITLPTEAFRVRALRRHGACPLEPEPGGPSEVTFTYRDDGWYQLRQKFAPGALKVRLRNETAQVVVVVIEQVRWDPRAITAAQALSLPEFRDPAQAEAPPARQSAQ